MINTYTELINPYDIYGYCYYADYEAPTGVDLSQVEKPKFKYPYTPWFGGYKETTNTDELGADLGDAASSAGVPCIWTYGLQAFWTNTTVQQVFNMP